MLKVHRTLDVSCQCIEQFVYNAAWSLQKVKRERFCDNGETDEKKDSRGRRKLCLRVVARITMLSAW